MSATSDRIAALVQSARGEALPPIEELVLLLQREIGQLRDPRQAAELKARAALLLWDGRGQSDAALRLLAGVDHPVAAALRLQGAVDASEGNWLLACADEVQRRGDAEEVGEVGELLLWRGEPGRAAALLERAGDGQRPLRALALHLAGRHAEAVEVLSAGADPQGLLLAAHLAEDHLGDSERARTLLRRLLERPGLSTAELVRATERLMDIEARRGGEAGRIELLRRKLELLGGLPAVEAALAEPAVQHAKLMLCALWLGQALERSSAAAVLPEAAALFGAVHRYGVASPEGAALIGLLGALRARARTEAACGRAAEAAALFEELGERLAALPGHDPLVRTFAGAYARRAAELLEARGGPEGAARARALYERLLEAEPEDEALPWALCRVLLRGGQASAAAHLLLHRASLGTPGLLLRAARAAEAVGGGAEDLLAGSSVEDDRPLLELLCRVYRRRADRPRLCAVYRRLGALPAAPGSAAARRAAAYLAAAAALALEALPEREAEALLSSEEARREAAQPGGLLLSLAQLLHLRRLGRRDELLPTLAALLPHVSDPGTQAELHRQLAREALEHRGDLELAQHSFQRALATRPDDVASLAALAELRRDSHPAEAMGLLRQAVDAALRLSARPVSGGLSGSSSGVPSIAPSAASDGGEAASGGPAAARPAAQAAALLLCELAGMQERAEDEASEAQAAASYEEALRHDPACRPAAEALTRLYRRSRRPGELLAALERLLPSTAVPGERRALLIEIGRAAEEQAALAAPEGRGAPAGAGGGGADAGLPEAPAFDAHSAERALSAYAEALGLPPAAESGDGAGDLDELIGRLADLARRTDSWAPLCAALERGPRTARTLKLLIEASARLGRVADEARYREEELAILTEPREVLRAARALTELYEAHPELPGGAEVARRAFGRAYQLEPEGTLALPGVAEMLESLFQEEGRFGDLASLLGRQLEDIAARLDGLDAQGGADAAGAPGEALAAAPAVPSSPGAASDAGEAAPAKEKDEVAALRARGRALLLRLGALRRDHLGAPADAAAAFEQVLRDHPQDPEALAALSTVYSGQQERSGELRRVLDLRAKAATDPVERAAVLVQAGELAEKAGDLAAAEEAYAEAFSLDLPSRAAFTALERVLYRLEKWPEAMRMYEAAIALVEQQKSRAYRLGDLYARRGQVLQQYLHQPEEAAAAYLRALEADPDNDGTQAALERLYVAESNWPALIAAYEKRAAALRDDGKRVEVLRRAARVAAAKLRDVAEAIRLYQKLHTIDPTDSEALDALERHYERAREFDKLLSVLGTRLALSTSDQEAAALGMRIGQLHEEGLRDHEKSIEAYRQVLEHQPNHREALDGLARLFEANERWAELIEVTRRQIRLTTDRTQKALLYFKCGSVMEAKFGKEDDAVRYYDAAVKTSPSCLPAVHGLRDIHLRREDWPRVTQTLELEAKLWTEDKERAGIYAHIGQIYREKLHDLDRAIQYYESALAVDKDCLPANRALFEVYFDRGDYDRAVPMGQVLSAKVNREGEPRERSEFYRKRALVADHTGDLPTAAESLVVALEIMPENVTALEALVALCRRDPTIYDFAATFRELEKLYRRRGQDRALGLSLVARAVLAERAYDIEGAEALLGEAVRLSPADFAVTEALCALSEKLRRFSAAERALKAFIEACADQALVPEPAARATARARAQLRLAEMYSDAAMEPEQAAQALRDLFAAVEGAPEDAQPPPDLLRVARFRLVQELYLLGRYSEARAEIDDLIEQAVSPPPGAAAGSLAPPEELARYYDYLGRILEATADGPAAQRNYRRAIDLDPAYAQPVLALARRAAQAGDRAQAELLIREALTQAQRRGDPHEELRLRRGVARLLATFDPLQAIEAFRQCIQLGTSFLPPEAIKAAVPPELQSLPSGAQVIARETLDDRLAVADLLLGLGDVGAAQAEIHPVLLRDLRYAPAYRLLSQAYDQLGEIERAQRVQAVLTLLGYGDPAQLGGRGAFRPSIRRGTLDDEGRAQHLLLPAMRSPYLELLQAIAEHLVRELPPPWQGGESVLATKVADAGFKVCMTDVQRLFGIEAEVLVARGVPGGVLALEADPGGGSTAGTARVLWDASLLERPDGERRFLMGRALEPLRGGYAVALRLRPAERDEVARVLRVLLRPEAEWDAATREVYRSLPRRGQRVVERLMGAPLPTGVGEGGKAEAPPVLPFLQALPLCADRAGLLACDDISAAIRVLGRLQGEDLAVVDGTAGGVLVGQVSGGADLIRFFLSDGYEELRGAVRDATRL